MKKKISNQFLGNFVIIFIITILATVFAFSLISVASGLIANTLAKNRFPASSVIKADYQEIDATDIVKHGGGVQIVDNNYRVVYTAGLDTINKDAFTVSEFTAFLTESKSKAYHYDIIYQPEGKFWLIVTFPTSIRLDLKLIYNKDASLNDRLTAGSAFLSVALIYILTIAFFSYIYSRITALKITIPLKKLTEGTKLLREGDYSARVDLHLQNEFAELQDTFNDMAKRIEQEIVLRKKSEEARKQLILDISHDLKNPLTSIQGYAELLCQKDSSPELKVIHQNSLRANHLLNELFELSKLDSVEFSLKLNSVDLSEALRQICGDMIPLLEAANFNYEFAIPEEAVNVKLDTNHFPRVIQNLTDNAIRYNDPETTVTVSLMLDGNLAAILFSDDGIGIPKELAEGIFQPFIRGDASRNSKTGGSGLGLAIAKKIALAHGGDLTLEESDKGSKFKITIPLI